MMDNAAIADNFSLLSKLMDIHGENSFKSKTYSIAAFYIEKLPEQLSQTDRTVIPRIKGIGDSVARKVFEMLDTGAMTALNDIIADTPPGVIEMLNIKGIGPKKINTIWKEMAIESIGELQYACNENRLTLYKGFGQATQQKVLEAINFYLANQGHFLYAQLHPVFPQVQQYLHQLFGAAKVAATGAFRRQLLTIEEMAFVINEANDTIKPKFVSAYPPELLEETTDSLLYQLRNGLRLRLYTGTANFAQRVFDHSGSPEFVTSFYQQFPDLTIDTNNPDDAQYFTAANITWIPPFLRETVTIITTAQQNQLPVVIQPGDIKGIIHNHSNWSDGTNTIEEMAQALIAKGMEYLVISDHSKSATYANGLTEQRIAEQHKYVDELNKKLAPFKIYKSIECDILGTGQLDYSNDILASFDLVIASVHSNLQMSEEKAMQRLLTAIENPYTTILGHMTGRLLLSRNGYPVNHKTIIDACAAHNVVIELNAHPRRLDIDWQWIPYALEKNVLISINPDAHFIEGFNDVTYGVLAAQKGGLTKEHNLSSFSLAQFEAYTATRKANIS
jgi:DNA polymerase (family 10)